MKKRIIAVSLALMSLCLSANADVVQTLTINGQTVEKTVTQLTFSGDNVVLHFEGSEESYALDDVVLDFSDVSSTVSTLSSSTVLLTVVSTSPVLLQALRLLSSTSPVRRWLLSEQARRPHWSMSGISVRESTS